MSFRYFLFVIKGVVQGVGFRPFVYNSALKENIKGYVLNEGSYVKIISSDKEKMLKILSKPPKMAKIESINIKEIFLKEEFEDFKIKKSETKKGNLEENPPDYYMCDECFEDFKEEKNKRHNYEFTTCTNCGPRYSIIYKAPFDRENTSMNVFELCDSCKEEFINPRDRRYHAQTISCPECGPKVRLYFRDKIIGGIKECVELIKNDKIVAIKGVGGFHLVCNTKKEVVDKLRKKTKRKRKPYALMFKNLDSLKRYVYVSDKDQKVLESYERPILVLKKKKDYLKEISELDTIGCMLPYTPLHYLIFQEINEPLVFTSSNISGNPISSRKEEQFVDYVLDFNREIINPIDDSVIKSFGDYHLIIRRGRGFVPLLFRTKITYKNILAIGGDNNNTIGLYHKGKILISEHLGDLKDYESFLRFKKKVKEYMSKVKIDYILCDSNPNYISRNYALDISEKNKIELIEIQHHLAHSYSVALEQNLEDFISITSDGSGYGLDGTIWGGEVFYKTKRVGHLEEQPLIGGELAIKEPKYMAFGILSKFLNNKELKNKFKEMDIDTHLNKEHMKTTSCGRILDAVSYILGFCSYRDYQGRPAMLLESNTPDIEIEDFKKSRYYMKPLIEDNVLMTTPLIKFIFENIDIKDKKDKGMLAYCAQLYLAEGLYEIANNINKTKNRKMIFSGGCAYNRIMSSFMLEKGVLLNEKYPSGDGGLSFGQIGYWLMNKSE